MTLNHLRYFMAIVEHRSMRKAADHVHVTQPALSNCVRNLEAHYGVPLLERTANGVSATPFGAALHEFAAAALLQLDRAEHEMVALGKGHKGHINVAATGGLIDTVVPALIESLHASSPGLTYTVMFGFLDDLLQQLRTGRHDFLITTYWPEANLTEELQIIPLCQANLAIFARPEHPLASGRRLSVEELAAAQWVMPKSSGMNAFVRDVFGDNHMSILRNTVTTDNIPFMVSMLKRMDLLTIAPDFVVAAELSDGRLVRVPFAQRRQTLSIGLIHLKARFLTAALRRFRDTAIELTPHLVPQETPRKPGTYRGRLVPVADASRS